MNITHSFTRAARDVRQRITHMSDLNDEFVDYDASKILPMHMLAVAVYPHSQMAGVMEEEINYRMMAAMELLQWQIKNKAIAVFKIHTGELSAERIEQAVSAYDDILLDRKALPPETYESSVHTQAMIAQRNLLLPCLYLGDYLRAFETAPGHSSINLQGLSVMAALRGHGRNALEFWQRLNALEGWNHLFDEGPDNDRRYPKKPPRKKDRRKKTRLVWSPAPAATPA